MGVGIMDWSEIYNERGVCELFLFVLCLGLDLFWVIVGWFNYGLVNLMDFVKIVKEMIGIEEVLFIWDSVIWGEFVVFEDM